MNKEIVYWKMRNGKLISVDEMDINHLRKVLKMIIRNREKALQAKFKLNGDIAEDFNDSHYSDLDHVQWSDGEFYKE